MKRHLVNEEKNEIDINTQRKNICLMKEKGENEAEEKEKTLF